MLTNGRKNGADYANTDSRQPHTGTVVFSKAPLRIRKESGDEQMNRITMKIDGMMCGMCEAHVCDAIRKAVPSAKKVAASRSKKEASFLAEETVDPAGLKEAIDASGYTCLDIISAPYEKKGLFGRK